MRVLPFSYLEQKDEAAPSVVIPAHYIFTVQGTSYDGTTINRIAKVLSDGSIDSGFNTGMTGISLNNADYAGTTDGDYLYFGGMDASSNIAVFKVDATTGTLVAQSTTFDQAIFGVIPLGDYVYVFGNFTSSSGFNNRIARLNKSDLTDASSSTFFGTGFNNTTFGKALGVTSTHLYIGGTFTSYNSTSNTSGIVKLNLSNGVADSTFASNWNGSGLYTSDVRGMDLYNGYLYFGGFSFSNRIASIDTSGNANSTFNSGITSGFNNRVRDVVVNQKGQIGVQGQFTSYNGTTVQGFTVLDTNGSINSTFDAGSGSEMGGGQVGRAGWNSQFNTWVVGKTSSGAFSWNGTSVGNNAFINEDGTLNTTLTGTSVTGQVTFNNAPNPNELLR